MSSADRDHVLANLRNLREWADFIFDSLTSDRAGGHIKELVEDRTLRELRQLAFSLRQRLDIIEVEAENRSVSCV